MTVPAPGEYVAEGAAAQSAWALTGGRPSWNEGLRSTITAEAAPDIYANYSALRDRTGPDAGHSEPAIGRFVLSHESRLGHVIPTRPQVFRKWSRSNGPCMLLVLFSHDNPPVGQAARQC